MGEGIKDVLHGEPLSGIDAADELSEESSSFFGDSDSSMISSPEELADDASSSSTNSSSPSSNASQGPLYELSSLMAELPIKRGLSRYFQGKSQSFTSLSAAKCIEDLPKKQTPFRKRIKSSKSYAGGLDATSRPFYLPGIYSKTITKKTFRSSCASLIASSGSNLLCSSNRPPVPVHKNF